MPFVWHREVESYKVDVFKSSTLNYDRSIRLTLKPNGANTDHTVHVRFPLSPPSDYVDIGVGSTTIQIEREKFDEVYRMLQTESPVYFTAYEAGSPPIRFAGLTTDPEGLGEGFKDPDA